MRSLFGFGKTEAGETAEPKSEKPAEKAPALAPVFDHPAAARNIQEIPPLTPAEQQVLEKLRAEIPNLTHDLPEMDSDAVKYTDPEIPLDIESWLTDECLARYIRARKGNYDDAYRALRKTIEWRATTRPHALRPDVVEVENRTGKMYFNGFDRFSRPVIYMYNHRQNTKEADNQIRWVVYTLEMCIRHMVPGVEKVTLAIDATHWGFSNSVSVGTAKKFLDVLSNHYPERLGKAVVFSPPRFFVGFYNLVSPFIDPVTKAKVAFVDAAKTQDQPQEDNGGSSPWINIQDCFDPAELEKDCYGQSAFQYDHPTYWKAIEAEFAQTKANAIAAEGAATASIPPTAETTEQPKNDKE
ncbi:hypothetical protein GGI07_002704 [Coemansia sp. Benny D115]|nr:hypothetical protein GGI07_002704 [Coemansia sp. Benny D115]